jgi:hypothetical protein
LGASHQTGWTGLVAKHIELYGFLDAKRVLEVGRGAAFTEKARAAAKTERENLAKWRAGACVA